MPEFKHYKAIEVLKASSFILFFKKGALLIFQDKFVPFARRELVAYCQYSDLHSACAGLLQDTLRIF
jgi:hypothetical protein